MKSWGYGRGYQYAHDYEEKTTDMECLPESLSGKVYYRPTEEGLEKALGERIESLRKRKKKLKEEPK
jgi:putative ATPase